MHTRGGERNAKAWWSAYSEARGAETALTGLGSAGIRALQILFVREPAAGIASEGSSARYSALPSLLAAPFRLRSGLPVKCAGFRGGCKRG